MHSSGRTAAALAALHVSREKAMSKTPSEMPGLTATAVKHTSKIDLMKLVNRKSLKQDSRSLMNLCFPHLTPGRGIVESKPFSDFDLKFYIRIHFNNF
jgi:hypothetical protein